MSHILITGGAGFIGRRVARALLDRGHSVRAYDSLVEQVHVAGEPPADFPAGAELVVGDVRDEKLLGRALLGIDKVVHLAAEVGVGQSMYAIDRYVSANDLGTAMLFQRLIERPVERVVVASSMSIYGEGLYRSQEGVVLDDVTRNVLTPGASYDPLDSKGRPLIPVSTPEWKQPTLSSVYALTKYVQERLTLTLCPAYGMTGVALRLFNVFGSGQALSNPYTGVLAIFASRLLNGERPIVFEDGGQRRDFVHVDDVANAFCLALDKPGIDGETFNIGSGKHRSVKEIAEALSQAMGRSDLVPQITGKSRAGDTRHCFADTEKARTMLGFVAEKDFSAGLDELVGWVRRQTAVDKMVEAHGELVARGLVA